MLLARSLVLAGPQWVAGTTPPPTAYATQVAWSILPGVKSSLPMLRTSSVPRLGSSRECLRCSLVAARAASFSCAYRRCSSVACIGTDLRGHREIREWPNS